MLQPIKWYTVPTDRGNQGIGLSLSLLNLVQSQPQPFLFILLVSAFLPFFAREFLSLNSIYRIEGLPFPRLRIFVHNAKLMQRLNADEFNTGVFLWISHY